MARSDLTSAPAFHFTSKAGTLASLSRLVRNARFPEQITVDSAEWKIDTASLVDRVMQRFPDRRLAVRSSAASEDTAHSSMAGAHLSLIDVSPDAESVRKAIADVFRSYRTPQSADEVLIQPMVEQTAVAGVVLTRDLDTGAPYYVINYDDFSGRTDTVTGGAESKVVLVHRTKPNALRSPRFRCLIEAVREIEEATGNEELDVEFCIDLQDCIYILQVRPLAASRHWAAPIDGEIDQAIESVREKISRAMDGVPGVAGSKGTVFGEMPDWNPAEMIGSVPRPLAYSLYRTLITDRVWSLARAELGYRDVPHPLMTEFAGRPFVDVRLSLNSFLPATIDEGFATRLVDHQLGYLAAHPHLHDKLEFDVAITVRDLAFEQRCAVLQEGNFTADDIAGLGESLREVTQSMLDWSGDQMDSELALTTALANDAAGWESAWTPADAIGQLSDIRQRGTLPFSKLARLGFIAMLMLDSLVRRNVLSQRETEQFMLGIPTVATELVSDLQAVAAGRLKMAALLDRYGHLRPGAYDILSHRYDSRPDLYLSNLAATPSPLKSDVFVPSRSQMAETDMLLNEAGLTFDAPRLFDFIAAAVQAREKAKFNFMRAVSRLLELIAGWGDEQGLSRDDVSFMSIDRLMEARAFSDIRSSIVHGRDAHRVTQAIRLPHLIAETSDIDVIRLPLGQPNFITSTSVTAPTVALDTSVVHAIKGKIVLIESADPGFDWIFAHGIAGLITKYGGVNSHMAIRSAEFGLPAAIGCGTQLFEILRKSPVVELNCAAHMVKPGNNAS